LGIDVNKEKIAFMRKQLPLCNFSTIMPNSDRQYDCVLCIELLEHLKNPEEMLASISRLLKPDGRAVIATPDYSKKLWHLAEMFTPYKEEHIVKFTKETLEEVCGHYGLYPVEHRYIAGCDLVELFEKGVH